MPRMIEYFDHDSNIGKRVSDPMGVGEASLSHQHNFPHDTFALDNGAFRIDQLRYEGDVDPAQFEVIRSCIIDANARQTWALILANTWHRITCIRPGRYMCVFAARDQQGQVADRFDGWPRAFN